MSLNLKLVYSAPPFDFEGIKRRGEEAATAAVENLSTSQLCYPRTRLIEVLCANLELQAPQLLLDQAVDKPGDSDGFTRVREVPLEDPGALASLINAPVMPPWMEFDVICGPARVSVMRYCSDSEQDDSNDLSEAVFAYKRNINLASEHVDRFNSALPYLLSALIEDRLDPMPDPPF